MAGLRALSPEDYGLIGDIIADSFSDDPVNLWTFRNPAVMKPVFTEMAKSLYLTQGFGHVDDSGLAGTLWLPPGVHKHQGLWSTLVMARHIALKGGPKAVVNALRIDALMSSNHPQEPHYYLFAVGARQGYQGKGLGGALMREALRRADQEHMPAYLENSKPDNIGFYRHHGFEIMDEIRPARDAPPMFRMWRDAR